MSFMCSSTFFVLFSMWKFSDWVKFATSDYSHIKSTKLFDAIISYGKKEEEEEKCENSK